LIGSDEVEVESIGVTVEVFVGFVDGLIVTEEGNGEAGCVTWGVVVIVETTVVKVALWARSKFLRVIMCHTPENDLCVWATAMCG